MPKIAKLNVKLLDCSKNIEQTIAAAIRQCYSKLSARDLFIKISPDKRKQLINQVINSGHTSTIEHGLFTFTIEGISRVTSHQLVRHRIASYSQQSQRYVKFDDEDSFFIIVPPKIFARKNILKKYMEFMKSDYEFYSYLATEGIEPEDARYVLPNSCETKIVVSMNPRGLYNFFKERLCLRAQWEIRAMANEMLKIAKKKAPILFGH